MLINSLEDGGSKIGLDRNFGGGVLLSGGLCCVFGEGEREPERERKGDRERKGKRERERERERRKKERKKERKKGRKNPVHLRPPDPLQRNGKIPSQLLLHYARSYLVFLTSSVNRIETNDNDKKRRYLTLHTSNTDEKRQFKEMVDSTKKTFLASISPHLVNTGCLNLSFLSVKDCPNTTSRVLISRAYCFE